MRLIDADELKTAFPYGEYIRTESVRATIDHMPTIEPERKTGKWIKQKGDVNSYTHEFTCNACGETVILRNLTNRCKYRFCPNCGSYNAGGEE